MPIFIVNIDMKKKTAILIMASALTLMAGAAVPKAHGEGWKITVGNPSVKGYVGTAVANGTLSLVSSPELFSCSNSILEGTFDRADSLDVVRLLDCYRPLEGRMTIDGHGITRNGVKDFRQTLDMRNSLLECGFSIAGDADVFYRYVPLGGDPHVVMLMVEVLPLRDLTLGFSSYLQAPAGFRPLSTDSQTFGPEERKVTFISSSALSPMGRTELGVASAFCFDGVKQPVEARAPKGADPEISFRRELKKGQGFRFALLASEFNSSHTENPMPAAQRKVLDASLRGIDRLMERHGKYWDRMWRGDIRIDGPLADQQDIRQMIYSIYSSARPGGATSPSPFGLSCGGYSGHVFWDTELWMLPPMLVLNPDIARSMLDYRYDRLESARRLARQSGCAGARFPWESADSGDEQTPVFAVTGYQEIHVTACVALAAWDYWLVSHDLDWLREKGAPLIIEAADFWVSRSERDDRGRWHIRNVCGADEYAENVDDNAFTNASARKNLLVAGEAARLLGIDPDPRWREVAEGLTFNTSSEGVTQLFDGYDGAPTKQADVVLLSYPLGMITDGEQMMRDLEYYKGKVPERDVPAMTEGVYSVICSRLGRVEDAARYYRESYEGNITGGFRGIAECKGGTTPYFATGAGGALQAILMGFGGYEITPEGLRSNGNRALPPEWSDLEILVPVR